MDYIKMTLVEIEDYTTASEGLYRLNFLAQGNGNDLEGSGNVGFCTTGTVESTTVIDGVTRIESLNTSFGLLVEVGKHYDLGLEVMP